MSLKVPRASVVQKARRLNRARLLLLEGVPRCDAAQRLTQEFSLSPRQAYRYLHQAHRLKEAVSRGEEKLAFTVKLPHSQIQWIRAYAAAKHMLISDVVSRALLAQLPRSGTFAKYAGTPGPDKTSISLDLVESLASIGCTLEEIAGVLGVSKRTLQRREQEETFRKALSKGRALGRVSIRRAQWKSMMGGNGKASIRLGKKMLGQRESGPREKSTDQNEIPPLVIQVYPDNEGRPDNEEDGCSKGKS
jgi:AraC-like DNA-binding protein